MPAQQFMELLFGKLPDFFKNEAELRALWSAPDTRKRLLEGLAEEQARGLFVQAIRPPTVPEGTSRLRLTISAHHTEQDVAELAQALADLPHRRDRKSV